MKEKIKLLGVKEVADLLGICQDTARKIMKSKDFPLFLAGNRMKVEEQALIHYIRKEEFKEKI